MKANPLSLKIAVLAGLLATGFALLGQSRDSAATQDLNFLIGEWQVERIYSPGTDNRILKGTLSCQSSLDDQFIQCRYEMERPGKIRGLDEVYFNYNSIYDQYESLWLSSTWPIKVLMQGSLEKDSDSLRLNTAAEFLIQDNVMEYVRGSLVASAQSQPDSFYRNTFIRTSEYAEGVWLHHMVERVTRVR